MFNPRSSIRAAIIHNSRADFSAAKAIVSAPAAEQIEMARAYLGNAKTSYIMFNGRRSRATKLYNAADCRALIARAKKIVKHGKWFYTITETYALGADAGKQKTTVFACSLSPMGGKSGFFPGF